MMTACLTWSSPPAGYAAERAGLPRFVTSFFTGLEIRSSPRWRQTRTRGRSAAPHPQPPASPNRARHPNRKPIPRALSP